MAGREGTRFGPYQLSRRLGGGVAGEVYLAEGGPVSPGASGSGRLAVKIIAGAATDPITTEIALQAEQAGNLKHPNIIPFHGIIQDDGALGVVMAFAPGGSLGDAFASRGTDGAARVTLPLAPPVAARIIGQVARALSAAHNAGLVHADLKPNNIFVRTSPSGSPLTVLGDFGQGVLTQSALALVTQGDAADPRRRSWADGQLLSAAPEQLSGGDPTPLSDQYALASLAYLLLVGESPISGSGPALLTAIASTPVAAPSTRNPRLPAAVDAVLLRALAKQPAQRFPTVATFAEALDEALAVPAGASMQRGNITAGMAQLSGSPPAMRTPTSGGASPTAGASRSYSSATLTGPSGNSFTSLGGDAAIPEVDASPGANRRLAIIAGSAMLLVVLACIFLFRAFTGGILLPQIHLGGGSSTTNATATPKANASATAVANSALARLHAATTGQPQLQDALTTSSHGWQTKSKTLFFAKDGYHFANADAAAALAVDAPGSLPPYPTLVVRTDIVFAQGHSNDFAGVRVYDDPNGDYYAFLVSTEGRYEAWQHIDGAWTLLEDGFIGKYNLGIGAKNTVEVLADSQNTNTPQAWLFVNGQYINSVALNSQGPYAGGGGLILKQPGAEAVFSNFALYGSGG